MDLREGKKLELLRKHGRMLSDIQGISMLPFLRQGKDVVELEDIEKYLSHSSLHKFDVVLYRRYSGELVLHRLYGQDEEGFWFRGDHEYFYERRVNREQLQAVMVGFYRGKRYVSAEDKGYKLLVRIWCKSGKIRGCIRKLFRKMKGLE